MHGIITSSTYNYIVYTIASKHTSGKEGTTEDCRLVEGEDFACLHKRPPAIVLNNG